MTYDLPSRVEKGKEISYSINYFSNIDYPLENLSLKTDPVKGFNFKSSDPSSLDNSEWKLGVLNKSEGGRVSIKGTVSSEAESALNFSVHLGIWQDGNFIIIKDVEEEIKIIEPLLTISQTINGSSNYSPSPGESLIYEISFKNMGSTPFDNLFAVVRLSGSAFDLLTLSSYEGEAKLSDNLIVFDPNRAYVLRRLEPKKEVKVSFSVKLKPDLDVSNYENAIIKNKIDAGGISYEFEAKVSSKIFVSQKAYHSNINGIENSGPIPPKAGDVTTYAVLWEVKSNFSEIRNIKIRAILPQNVSLQDNMFPESEALNFSFDGKSREILWNAGSLSPNSSKTISFQIALTPSFFQKGSLANLIGQASVSGEDQFTKTMIKSSDPSVNSDLPDDSGNSGGGVVQ